MPDVKIIIDGLQEPIPGLPNDRSTVLTADLKSVAVLSDGMQSGRPGVALVGQLADGRTVFMETSLRIFQAAAGAFTGRYGEDDGARVKLGPGGVELGWVDDGN